MSVVGFKLISGEELLGEFDAEKSTADMIVLKQPVALVMMQTKEGVRGTFMPYVQSNPEIESLSFPTCHMTCTPFAVAPAVADGYIKAHSKLDLSASRAGLSLVKP